MRNLYDLARELSAPERLLGGPCLQIGSTYRHPNSGKLVRIMSGQYMGTYGVSNFWRWREVLEDGSLGEEECGYGWTGKPVE